MRSERQRLKDMLDAALVVQRRVSTMSRTDFDADEFLRFGIRHGIQIVGEAAYHVGIEVRTTAPELPWKRIVGMRHLLVHEYYRIDNDTVWRVATENVRDLVTILNPVVQSFGDLSGEEVL